MARTLRAPQTVVRAGLAPAYTAADQANGEYFVNDGSPCMLHVKNVNAATRTVTVKRNITIDGAVLPDLIDTVPANTGDLMIGPFPQSLGFIQADGSTYVDYSASAGLTVALIKLVQ